MSWKIRSRGRREDARIWRSRSAKLKESSRYHKIALSLNNYIIQLAQETIEELNRQRHEQEQALKKKDAEIHNLQSRLEDEQSLVAKLQKHIKELLAKIQELEEELEAERQSRAKVLRVFPELF